MLSTPNDRRVRFVRNGQVAAPVYKTGVVTTTVITVDIRGYHGPGSLFFKSRQTSSIV